MAEAALTDRSTRAGTLATGCGSTGLPHREWKPTLQDWEEVKPRHSSKDIDQLWVFRSTLEQPCGSSAQRIPACGGPEIIRQRILRGHQPTYEVMDTPDDDTTDETRNRPPSDPIDRLDEALKQIEIANEEARIDIEAELQAASEALDAARMKLAADE